MNRLRLFRLVFYFPVKFEEFFKGSQDDGKLGPGLRSRDTGIVSNTDFYKPKTRLIGPGQELGRDHGAARAQGYFVDHFAFDHLKSAIHIPYFKSEKHFYQ